MANPASTPIPLSGYSIIDGLLSGGIWFSSNEPLTLTWGTANNPYQGYYWTDPATTAGDIQSVVQQWANVANIKFSYSGHFSDFTTAPVDIAVSISDSVFLGGVAEAVFPLTTWGDSILVRTGFTRSSWPQPEGDIFANIDYQTNDNRELVYLAHHELGHSLGLKHPHDGGPEGNPTFVQLGITDFDATYYTVMSYDGSDGFGVDLYPATPMPLDILAVQHLYGANLTHRTGNDTYHLGETGYMQTIWDAGGRDVFDASSSPAAVAIDLNDFDGTGAGYSFHGLDSVTAIAAGVTIERAIGSGFDDVLLGNEVNNRLSGLGGNDSLFGGRGDDVMRGSGGDDLLVGGAGNDRLIGGAGVDLLRGNDGNDLMRGGGGNDKFIGGPGADSLFGGGGNDVLKGGGASDTIVAGAGADILVGGPGADTFVYKSIAHIGTGSNRDVVRGFQPGIDEIDLSSIDANKSAGGDQAFDYIGTANFSAAGQLRYDSGILYGDVDGDGQADFELRLANSPLLSGDDVLL